jgi:hypothetical protein
MLTPQPNVPITESVLIKKDDDYNVMRQRRRRRRKRKVKERKEKRNNLLNLSFNKSENVIRRGKNTNV